MEVNVIIMRQERFGQNPYANTILTKDLASTVYLVKI
jgi:hypothetical protein